MSENVVQHRMKSYGDPVSRMQAIDDIYSILFDLRGDTSMLPGQRYLVAMLIDKITRVMRDPRKRDNFVDLKGYAEIGLQILDARAAGENAGAVHQKKIH